MCVQLREAEAFLRAAGLDPAQVAKLSSENEHKKHKKSKKSHKHSSKEGKHKHKHKDASDR